MRFRDISRCLAWAGSLILAATCAAQVAQPAGTMPDGQQVQVPQAPPQSDQATVPANPFPDNGQDATPPETTAPQDQNDSDTAPDADQPLPEDNQPETPPETPDTPPAAVRTGTVTHAPAAAPAPAPAPRALPSSLMDKPAAPATVRLSAGELAVEANNSSLSQILHQLASDSGMKINGLSADQRVFGSYGPGAPRDVLSSLLVGAHYNVLMVGSTRDGAPRELILTPRSNGPVSQPQNTASTQQDDDDDQNVDNNPPPEYTPPPRMPPQIQQQNPNGTVKTPAQILQELEQLRRQQRPQ